VAGIPIPPCSLMWMRTAPCESSIPGLDWTVRRRRNVASNKRCCP
jgi:hypothetical protein